MIPAECRSGQWWLEAGPDLPPEAQLVEGPLVRDHGRCPATLVVHDNLRLGPGDRVAMARRLAKRDEHILDQIKEAEDQRLSATTVIDALNSRAHEAAKSRQPGARCLSDARSRAKSASQFLKTSYKTRGQKERKEKLFPSLQKEIAEDKENTEGWCHLVRSKR